MDLVFGGTTGSSLEPAQILFVLGKLGDGDLGMKLEKLVPNDDINASTLTWSTGGEDHVLTLGRNGVVREFSGWPLVELRSFNTVVNSFSAAVGDIDSDGTDELIVLTQFEVLAYSLSDGLLEWSLPLSGYYDVALAQLDADAALEIILGGGSPGLVLDGATLGTDWSYAGGFGSRVAVGNLLAGIDTEWASSTAPRTISAFSANPWSMLWNNIATSGNIAALATARIDNSGLDMILAADDQWGSVHVYDPVTQLERFSVPNGGWGVNAVGSTDLDGDGNAEIVFAATTADQRQTLITVADGRDGAFKWEFHPPTNPYFATAVGDVDGDGDMELVAAAPPEFSGYGTIELFDMSTGISMWRSPTPPLTAFSPFYLNAYRVQLVPNAGTTGMDIVLAGEGFGGGRIEVVDGTNMQVTLQIGASNPGPMRSRRITGLVLLDHDGDGIADFAVSTVPTSSGATGAKLYVFSGLNGQELWSTTSLGENSLNVTDLMLRERADGVGDQLIAVLPNGLRGVNANTGELEWSLAATNSGAIYIPFGARGPELAVYLDGGAMTFYDADTLGYLRSFVLPARLAAVAAPRGDIQSLVVAAGDALAYVDGNSGEIRATANNMGPFADYGNKLSMVEELPGTWFVASATRSAVFRHRIVLVDQIFSDGFDVTE